MSLLRIEEGGRRKRTERNGGEKKEGREKEEGRGKEEGEEGRWEKTKE